MKHPESASLERLKMEIDWLNGSLSDLQERIFSDDDVRSDQELDVITNRLSEIREEILKLILNEDSQDRED